MPGAGITSTKESLATVASSRASSFFSTFCMSRGSPMWKRRPFERTESALSVRSS